MQVVCDDLRLHFEEAGEVRNRAIEEVQHFERVEVAKVLTEDRLPPRKRQKVSL